MKDIKLVELKGKDIVAKRNYVVLFLPVALILILLASLYVYNTNTSKIKRYLSNNKYECNKVECTTQIEEIQYSIDVNNLDLTATNDRYIIKINENAITLQTRSDKKTCTYTSNQYSRTKLIDDTYSYTVYCQEYVPEINSLLNDYQIIITESKVNIEK